MNKFLLMYFTIVNKIRGCVNSSRWLDNLPKAMDESASKDLFFCKHHPNTRLRGGGSMYNSLRYCLGLDGKYFTLENILHYVLRGTKDLALVNIQHILVNERKQGIFLPSLGLNESCTIPL